MSDDVRWSITDPLGNKIVLKTSTFDEHILSECPREILAHPSLIAEDNSRHLYYGAVISHDENELRVKILKVVVDIEKTPNEIVTWTTLRNGDEIENGVILYGQRIFVPD